MKAVIRKQYGPPEVMKIAEVPKPAPKDDEVCIRILATAVTNSDIFIRGSELPFYILVPFRFMMVIFSPRKPIIGLVFSGEIESVGSKIQRFKPGDAVYGLTGYGLGAYAEYKCMKETDSTYGCIGHKPGNISHEEATMVAYGGLLAFQFLEKGNIGKGQNVLIYGASGTTGTMAIQIAAQLGAEVTAVCSTANLEMVKKLRAHHALDYTKENAVPSGVKYDLILDAVGKAKTSNLKEACKKALHKDGSYVSIDDAALKLDSKRLDKVREFVESGFVKPVLDKIYDLEDIVEAHRYVEKGHKKGGVAVTVQ